MRLRPLNEKEKRAGTLPVVSSSTSDSTVSIIRGEGKRQARSGFKVDSVFGSFATQEEVRQHLWIHIRSTYDIHSLRAWPRSTLRSARCRSSTTRCRRSSPT